VRRNREPADPSALALRPRHTRQASHRAAHYSKKIPPLHASSLGSKKEHRIDSNERIGRAGHVDYRSIGAAAIPQHRMAARDKSRASRRFGPESWMSAIHLIATS
jgi:hypothetical protein